MSGKNAIYAQSGGVTSVINATACGVIQALLKSDQINKVYAAKNGILGVLEENIYDLTLESADDIALLKKTPGGAFGSCRYKLKSIEDNKDQYERLVEVFKAHDIGYFFYNGGGDSQDTANKVSQIAEQMDYPLTCIGVPKTIDNDLPHTDCSPGFGSVAKYIATSTMEAALDVQSMAETSTKVFVLEVMGRHAGWIAAASALARSNATTAPHLIILPEVAFDQPAFLEKVKQTVEDKGFCVIVVSEGAQYEDGKFLAEAGSTDAFGHAQLGGVAPFIANMIKDNLGYKYHWAVSDYLQRSARHIASKTDVDQAYAMGEAAVSLALNGKNAYMPVIIREQDSPYQWSVGEVALNEVANQEKMMPADYIDAENFDITEKAMTYLRPLIEGEDYPEYENGVPKYAKLALNLIDKKLEAFK